jgi:hypothetical protein
MNQMSWNLLQSVGIPLAVMMYLLVTGILCTLAAQRNKAVKRHMLIRETRQRRREYAQAGLNRGE